MGVLAALASGCLGLVCAWRSRVRSGRVLGILGTLLNFVLVAWGAWAVLSR